jgi:adenosine deaminase
VNSDDPAYFGAYVNQNLAAAQQAVGLTRAELARLARNSFEIAWLSPPDQARYLADLDAYLRKAAPWPAPPRAAVTSRRTRCPPGRTA